MLDAAAEGAACGDSGAGTPVALRSPATRLSFTPSGPRHDATTGGDGYSPSGGGTDTTARTDSEEELRRQLALANAEIDAQAEVVARLRAQLRNSGDGAAMKAVQASDSQAGMLAASVAQVQPASPGVRGTARGSRPAADEGPAQQCVAC